MLRLAVPQWRSQGLLFVSDDQDHRVLGFKDFPRTFHSLSSSRWSYPGPGSPRIDQLSVWRVVAQQQRPDPVAAAFRVRPADDDEFLAV